MIFVTGCARSGTSLITRMLRAHGCYLGRENRINTLFENVTVRENILKSYLICIDADPLGQSKLPDTDNLPLVPDLHDRIMECFAEGSEPYAYKDAKITLVWPIFHAAFPEAKWVLVRRDAPGIVDSCMRALFMRKRKTVHEWYEWVAQHEKRFEKMRDSLDLVEVWTDEVINTPEEFARVTDHCQLRFSLAATERAIDHRLWHARQENRAAVR